MDLASWVLREISLRLPHLSTAGRLEQGGGSYEGQEHEVMETQAAERATCPGDGMNSGTVYFHQLPW